MKNLIAITTLSLALASGSVVADESSTESSKQHTFGLSAAAGGAEYKGSSADGDGVAHLYGYYNFNINKNFSFEAGLIAGTDADDWRCEEVEDDEWECRSDNDPIFNLQADELTYGSLVVAMKGKLELTARNSLYAKVGGQFYDYEFQRDNQKLESEDGFGAFLEAGWQYQWDSGWGINAGYQYVDMGDLEISTLNFGASYSF
ncbi:MAG: porin family protein [Kangiellaceae bacterium]|jgi:opacity protein-like surface antigen